MTRARVMLVLAAVGCNSAFGLESTAILDAADPALVDAAAPDRDRDGVHDDEDPCIASIADRLVDWDGDAFVNEIDDCPFDTGGTSDPDADGDGVGDLCDPLLNAGGDRKRCVMAFQNPTITRELLVPRSGDTAIWDLVRRTSIRGMGTGTLVAAETFEAPIATSYDLPLQIAMPAGSGAFTFWLSTSETAASGDVGCEVRGDASSVTVAVRGTSTEAPIAGRGVHHLTRIQAAMLHGVTGRDNVRCIFQFATTTSAGLDAEVSIAPRARIGVGIEALSAYVFGLTILERDDAPAL